MNIGFSYIGLIWLCMFFVPKYFLKKNYPKDKYIKCDNKVLGILKNIGQFMIVPTALIFSDFNYNGFNFWTSVIILSFLSMVMYDLVCFRYLKSDRALKDYYKSLLGIPVAIATLPVMAFFLLGVYGGNFLMIFASIILGIGHISICLKHKKQVYGKKAKRKLSLRIIFGVLKVVMIIIIVGVCGVFTFFIGWRNLKQIKRYNMFKDGIDEQRYVKLNDEEEFITISGKDTNNPICIYLHGGPGGADSVWSNYWTDYLADDYTFVCWDQRGCGRTYYKNASTDPDNKNLSVEQQLSDLDKLVDYICDRFDKSKVAIIGHSYGTVLGSRYCLANPDKVSHYVGMGQVVNMSNHADQKYIYEEALKKAEQKGDDTTDMKKAYEKFMSDDSVDNLLSLRKCVDKYYDSSKSNISLGFFSSPLMNSYDAKWALQGLFDADKDLDLQKPLLDYLENVNYMETKDNYNMPVLFIGGTEDHQCPTGMVKEYAKTITSTSVNVEELKGHGHTLHCSSYPQDITEKIKDFLKE